MQHKTTNAPLGDVSNVPHHSLHGFEEGDARNAPKADKGKKKQEEIQPTSQDSKSSVPRVGAKFDPHNLKDDEGNLVLIATTSDGRRSKDVCSAEAAFVQTGKRKADQLDVDGEEDDEWAIHEERNKRPRLDDYLPYLDVPSAQCDDTLDGENEVPINGDEGHVDSTVDRPSAGSVLETDQSKPLQFWELSEEDTLFNALSFSLFNDTSFFSEYENGDNNATLFGSQFNGNDCIYEHIATDVDPQYLSQSPVYRPKGRSRRRSRVVAVTWGDIFQPSFALQTETSPNDDHEAEETGDKGVPQSDHESPICNTPDCTAVCSSTAISTTTTPPPPNATEDDPESSEDEVTLSSSEIRFPYTDRVGEIIKRLVAAKNATAARRYIPRDQDIASAEGADITRLGLRNPWAKKKLFYCRFKARLVDGTWDYSDLPCHEEEGQNIGYSTRDDAVRHLREHHYEMMRPPEKKKGKGKRTATGGKSKTANDEEIKPKEDEEKTEEEERGDEDDDEYVP